MSLDSSMRTKGFFIWSMFEYSSFWIFRYRSRARADTDLSCLRASSGASVCFCRSFLNSSVSRLPSRLSRNSFVALMKSSNRMPGQLHSGQVIRRCSSSTSKIREGAFKLLLNE